ACWRVRGMPPPEPGIHSTRPPRRWGGNIDCKELVAGTTLFLPIPVDGALFSARDGHAAQGDGDVSGWAMETHAAARRARQGSVARMEREHGPPHADALALASVAVDLRVTQVVNEALGIHAVL